MSTLLTRISLKEPLAPLTVRLLMNKAQAAEIAERLRGLRDNSRETNRTIGDYCGVAERTVAGWASPTNPMGLTYDHAEKVAELFGVDPSWFWRGEKEGKLDGSLTGRLDRIEDLQEQALERLDALTASLASISDVPESGPATRRAGKQASATKSRRAKRRARAANP
jgi:transcriptional regulator with XRE-family HTH domain